MGQLLECQPERFGIRELPVQEMERGAQRSKLLILELNRWQIEVLRRQAVVLRFVVALRALLDLELDAELRPQLDRVEDAIRRVRCTLNRRHGQ